MRWYIAGLYGLHFTSIWNILNVHFVWQFVCQQYSTRNNGIIENALQEFGSILCKCIVEDRDLSNPDIIWELF